MALAAALCSASFGQVDGRATWLWEVTTRDGDSVVEPGESATVSLSLDMEPDVDYPDGPVFGLAGVAFDLIGDEGASHGDVDSWMLNPALETLFGNVTEIDGANLLNTHAGQTFEVFSPDDPIFVFSFVWTPEDYGQYSVGYSSVSWAPFDQVPALGTANVWTGSDFPLSTTWPIEEAGISFQVVPAPAALALLLLGSAGCRRGRGSERC